MFKVLPSGTLVWLEQRGKVQVAEVATCSWLIEVPSGNPEPDFPSDCWITQECGAKVKSMDGTEDWTKCEAGHERAAYGSQRGWELDMEAEYAERHGR